MTCSKSDFVILVDVGNTAATMAISMDGSIAGRGRLLTVDNNAKAVRKTLARLIAKRRAVAAVFCSVVPRVNKLWLRELGAIVGKNIVEVSHKVDLGLRIRCRNPQTIGADRLADACGAVWRHGAPVIVADFGTATTIDVISRDGAYEGGAIAPGPMMMTDCLAERTALLPRIKAFQRCSGIGRNTREAMTIGAVVGYRGLVREIVAHLLKATKERSVTLCATGGYAGRVLRGLDMPFIIDPDLTLRGLWRIHELNGCGGSVQRRVL
ncbi:MAG: type III pantothenate kinase [bacterium]